MTPVAMTPEAIAANYGLPWGVAAALFGLLVWAYKRECARNDKLTEVLLGVVGDVQTILALMQKGGRPA